jgi:hypothetical protein
MNEARSTVLMRETLVGACCACARAAMKCVVAGKFHCRGWVASEHRIAAILASDTAKTCPGGATEGYQGHDSTTNVK